MATQPEHQTSGLKMTTTITILFFGVAYGMILYLISVGLSITMGLMGFVNLAHGVFAMLGGYAMVTLMNRLGVPFFPALLIACALVTVLGFILERQLYSRLYGRSELDQVLFSMGLILVSMAVVRMVWGPLAQPIQLPDYLKGQSNIGGIDLPTYRLALVAFGATVIGALLVTFERTLFGARIRAAVDNRAMAQAIGINTNRLFAVTFALGTGLAALGGGLGADVLAIVPSYPLQHLVYFMVVVAVGGMGSIRGPFIAALSIGLADTSCKYLVPEVGAIFIFILIFALLLWRPNGIAGNR